MYSDQVLTGNHSQKYKSLYAGLRKRVHDGRRGVGTCSCDGPASQIHDADGTTLFVELVEGRRNGEDLWDKTMRAFCINLFKVHKSRRILLIIVIQIF